jgi:ribosome-associated translation inhibitor RaiA
MGTVHLRPHWSLIVCFLFCPATGLGAPQEEDINYEMVRCNPILRHVLSANSPYPTATTEESAEYKFRENWVDAQVDRFVEQTYHKLSELKASVQRASSASSELAADNSGNRAQALVTLRQALIKTENQSKDLRTSLSMVLVDLETKDKFQVKVSLASQAAGFKAEIEALSEQTANAERFIRDYFFKPTHVTSIADLKSANMLDYLKRVERIAHAIREKL